MRKAIACGPVDETWPVLPIPTKIKRLKHFQEKSLRDSLWKSGPAKTSRGTGVTAVSKTLGFHISQSELGWGTPRAATIVIGALRLSRLTKAFSGDSYRLWRSNLLYWSRGDLRYTQLSNYDDKFLGAPVTGARRPSLSGLMNVPTPGTPPVCPWTAPVDFHRIRERIWLYQILTNRCSCSLTMWMCAPVGVSLWHMYYECTYQ